MLPPPPLPPPPSFPPPVTGEANCAVGVPAAVHPAHARTSQRRAVAMAACIASVSTAAAIRRVHCDPACLRPLCTHVTPVGRRTGREYRYACRGDDVFPQPAHGALLSRVRST